LIWLPRMAQLCLALLGLTVGAAASPQRDFVPFFGSRGARSLVGTFPFRSAAVHCCSALHCTAPSSDAGPLPGREQRQDNSVSSIPFNEVASSYAGGKRWAAGDTSKQGSGFRNVDCGF
jgi:hypothetical protein